MPILMPKDTRDALGSNAAKCDSRSLYFDRFADPQAKVDERNAWFRRVVALKPLPAKCGAWKTWLGNLGTGLKSKCVLFAKLQARLMVNMAGGAMENAGLCLDRFGVLYIPGSAVKGCARRIAIQNLLEAREAQESADRLARLLADLALVFGWGEQDWKTRSDVVSKLKPKGNDTDEQFAQYCQKSWKEKRADFAYAVGDTLWPDVSIAARHLLPKTDHFAGAVSFLPAYPLQLPLSDLELDVLTCHHPKYYQGDAKMPVALDTEEPNPVMFPAAAANIIFQFAVLPIRDHLSSLSQPDTKLHALAVEWLRQGLETFGLGAKTAAGYGWFDASEDFNRQMLENEAMETARLRKREEEEAEKLRRRKQEEERIKKFEQEKQTLASLTPEQQEDYKVAQLKPDQFRAKLDSFLTNKVETEKQAVVRALRLDPAALGSRRSFWDELKTKAQKKGGKFAQVEQSVRQISKQLNLGKMP